jgi:hypothetical protein
MSEVNSFCLRRSKRIQSALPRLDEQEDLKQVEKLVELQRQLASQIPFSNKTSENFHLDIVYDNVKGYGVKTRELIPKDSYILEYRGELLRGMEIRKREKAYQDCEHDVGCYMFHFKYLETNWCIDGTIETPSTGFGRYLNHSYKNSNIKPRLVCDIDGNPHIVFFAIQNIEPEEELLFSYGERNNVALNNFPWLKE